MRGRGGRFVRRRGRLDPAPRGPIRDRRDSSYLPADQHLPAAVKDINGDEIMIADRQPNDYERGYRDAMDDHKGGAFFVLIGGAAAGAACVALYVWAWGMLTQ